MGLEEDRLEEGIGGGSAPTRGCKAGGSRAYRLLDLYLNYRRLKQVL
jgi:hypothetical protein